jgi:hypothetical protein
MEKFLLTVGLLPLAIGILASVSYKSQIFAAEGCCKERPSLASAWRPNGMSFRECENLNRKDGDNVFDQRGLVWWDVRCR